jgi:hypothetical protein
LRRDLDEKLFVPDARYAAVELVENVAAVIETDIGDSGLAASVDQLICAERVMISPCSLKEF